MRPNRLRNDREIEKTRFWWVWVGGLLGAQSVGLRVRMESEWSAVHLATRPRRVRYPGSLIGPNGRETGSDLRTRPEDALRTISERYRRSQALVRMSEKVPEKDRRNFKMRYLGHF